MQELETLLNSLLERGRKPRWNSYDGFKVSSWELCLIYKWHCSNPLENLRELVSIDSGIWQFVCKNNLYKKEAKNFRENVRTDSPNLGWFIHNYQYRLLESALIPEEELGKFLVDNIVVEWLKSEQSKK